MPPTPRRSLSQSIAVAMLCAAASERSAAQSNDEVMSAAQFNFSTPGARSLAMGGAFVAVADDATAAYANPAGLTQLVAPEVSIEGRAWSYTSRFAERGHLPETGVTGIGVDTIDGLANGTRRQSTAAPSFASYEHTGNRWSAALYRHELADFRSSLDTEGPFVGSRSNAQRLAPARSRLQLGIVHYGLAAAARVGRRVSLGVAASHAEFELASHTDRYFRAEPTGDLLVDGLTGNHFGPADFRPQNVLNAQLQSGKDSAFAWSAGVLWRVNSAWTLGAATRRGPEFDFTATAIDGPASPTPGRIDEDLSGRGRFKVPDSLSAGVSWRPRDTWLISLDWSRVEYSDLTANLINVLRAARGEREFFRADDADELHLGGEVQLLRPRYPVSLRAGAWFDPEHRIHYTGSGANLRARFRPGEDQLHWAAGAGLVLGRTQVDLAIDRSAAVDTLALSAVTRF